VARRASVRAAAAPSEDDNHRTLTSISTPRAVQTDFLVLGSGIAGLTFALRAADLGTVAVVTKGAASDGCTAYAQGGVSAVLSATDSVAAHVRDTLLAGDGACDLAAVEAVCGDGAEALLELVALGARFDRIEEEEADEKKKEQPPLVSFSDPATPSTAEAAAALGLHLTREGGHSARRVAHAADATGAEVMRALLAAVRAHPRIKLYENRVALDLVVSKKSSPSNSSSSPLCLGADTAHALTRERCRFVAAATVLATGGAGRAFPLSTNPSVATGDGLAMALRAGVPAANLEFVQFHPTALAVVAARRKKQGEEESESEFSTSSPPATSRAALVTEAARGEGGLLLNLSGERFMPLYDPQRAELAPRDVVARAIHDQMSSRGEPHVLLDLRPLGEPALRKHFPTVTAACAAVGIDPVKEPVPVAPAQHYMCGGVAAGLSGETALEGLFAVGECAHSGLHGGNRLASNSLLEGLVFARRAADACDGAAAPAAAKRARELDGGASLKEAVATAPGMEGEGGEEGEEISSSSSASSSSSSSSSSKAARASPELALWISSRRAAAAQALGTAAGIVRTRQGLAVGAAELRRISAEVDALIEASWPQKKCSSSSSTPLPPPPAMPLELNELRNVLAVSEGIVASALSRKESIGGHYLADAPPKAKAAANKDEEEKKLAVVASAVTSSSSSPSSAPTVVDLETARAVCAAAAEIGIPLSSSSRREGRRGLGRRAATLASSSLPSSSKAKRSKHGSKGKAQRRQQLLLQGGQQPHSPSSSSSPSPSRQPSREVAVRSLLGDAEGQ